MKIHMMRALRNDEEVRHTDDESFCSSLWARRLPAEVIVKGLGGI